MCLANPQRACSGGFTLGSIETTGGFFRGHPIIRAGYARYPPHSMTNLLCDQKLRYSSPSTHSLEGQ